MALDFPANPTNGQTFGNYIYDASIPGWRNVNSGEGVGLQFKSGLVPVTPTSVNVTSGTATVDSTGLITVSSASDIKLNGIFSSGYRHYEIRYARPDSNSTSANVYIRFTTGGTDNSVSNYIYSGFYVQTSGYGAWPYSGAANWAQIGYWENAVLRIFNPNLPQATSGTWDVSYGQTRGIGQLGFTGATAFDGIQFSNNYYSGTFRVYGYN